jgi:hypothetical protein
LMRIFSFVNFKLVISFQNTRALRLVHTNCSNLSHLKEIENTNISPHSAVAQAPAGRSHPSIKAILALWLPSFWVYLWSCWVCIFRRENLVHALWLVGKHAHRSPAFDLTASSWTIHMLFHVTRGPGKDQ